MAFPGRPAHDFLLLIPVRRRAAFLHGPTPLPRAWGLSFFPARYRPWAVPARGGCAGPCFRAVEACDEGGCDVRDGVGR